MHIGIQAMRQNHQTHKGARKITLFGNQSRYADAVKIQRLNCIIWRCESWFNLNIYTRNKDSLNIQAKCGGMSITQKEEAPTCFSAYFLTVMLIMISKRAWRGGKGKIGTPCITGKIFETFHQVKESQQWLTLRLMLKSQ